MARHPHREFLPLLTTVHREAPVDLDHHPVARDHTPKRTSP
jgi:hypothetical protein